MNEPQVQELSNGVKVTELVEGKGLAAQQHSQVKVRFSCQVDGSEAAITTNCDFEFTLGSESVIQGWNIGLIGAKKGSQRIVYCPPNMAYGMVGFPPMIPPNSALKYTFEILSVKKGK